MARIDSSPSGGMTVDELARHADVPVRTIREYQTLRLLPPPRRAGRIGLYDGEHQRRLDLIARLQHRGYSLAGIKDLLLAWDSGTNLSELLGVEVGSTAIDETPLRLTRDLLAARLPALASPTSLRRAEEAGLVRVDGSDHVLVRSPALLTLIADAISAGIQFDDALGVVAAMREHLGRIADVIADAVVDRTPPTDEGRTRTVELESFFRRGRFLLFQSVMSLLADSVGEALASHAAATSGGDEVVAALERVRVGVVRDAASPSTGGVR